ncbi:hypothetical protein NQ317_002354, partial [Molorchus minor]
MTYHLWLKLQVFGKILMMNIRNNLFLFELSKNMSVVLTFVDLKHTEQGRQPTDQPDAVFASRHKDSNSVACIDDKCYVLTFSEYC